MAIVTGRTRFGRERIDFQPRITPQQMRPESWLGALFSRKPRYTGPTADELNAATVLCFRYGMSAEESLAAVATARSPQPGRAFRAFEWDPLPESPR
jgi:hypothetical protein